MKLITSSKQLRTGDVIRLTTKLSLYEFGRVKGRRVIWARTPSDLKNSGHSGLKDWIDGAIKDKIKIHTLNKKEQLAEAL